MSERERKIGVVGAGGVQGLLDGTTKGVYWILGSQGNLEKTSKEIWVEGYHILRVDHTIEDIQPCGQNAALIDLEDTARVAHSSMARRLTKCLEEQLPSDTIVVAEAHHDNFKATVDFYYLTSPRVKER